MGQRLDDDIVFIHENDIPVTKQLNTERALTIFCVETKHKDSVKTQLFDLGQSSILEMLSQYHSKGWRRHRHWTVAF